MHLQPLDFIASAQRAADAETQSERCCCEYVDKDNKPFHILGCCCNCADFDLAFTRLITCRRIESHHRRGMLLTFQDRLRIPWRGGAKQVSFETIMPMLALPLIIGMAAINAYTSAVMLISSSVFIGYALWHVRRTCHRTRFFCMWLFWSIVYMVALFEMTVPVLELLPEENYILVALSVASLCCLWRTKQRAVLNHVVQSSVAEDELPDITEASTAEEEEAAAQTALLLEHDLEDAEEASVQPNICASCRKYVPSRSAHCAVCGACIKRRDHHSYWLDCCIGERNHRWFLAGLLLGELALLLGANLTLTAVCHPFLVVRLAGVPVMLPDDCSEVFDEYELGLSFVIGVYAVVIAAYALIVLIRQIYIISRGTTLRGQYGNRKTCWSNWKAFLF